MAFHKWSDIKKKKFANNPELLERIEREVREELRKIKAETPTSTVAAATDPSTPSKEA